MMRCVVMGLFLLASLGGSPSWAGVSGSDRIGYDAGDDLSCGGIYRENVVHVKGLHFVCNESLFVVDGENNAPAVGTGDIRWYGGGDRAFCGYQIFGDTPGSGAVFAISSDQSMNGVRAGGLAIGQGAKLFMHAAGRWVVLKDSDPDVVKKFNCAGDGWKFGHDYVGDTTNQKLGQPFVFSDKKYCVHAGSNDDGKISAGFGCIP